MRDFFKPGRSVVHAGRAAVATSHPLASLVAIEVLRSGGNAVDAAIAAVAVQAVADPHMTGIGGDCFALYAPRGARTPIALNGSGAAPAAATVDWFAERGITEIALDSPHGVTVPGAIAAWARLIDDHGSRSLAELLAPAIQLAEDGFVVQPRVARDWARNADRLRHDPASVAALLPGGAAPAAGTMLRQPKLAATLRLLAAGGREAFYTGAVAEDAVTRLRELGGLHTLEDFARTEAEYIEPISTRYRGYDVFEIPPNGQGLAALMMLNALEGFDLGEGAMSEVERVHLFAEVNKQAYHHRDLLFADPVHHPVPVEELLSAGWAAHARERVVRDRATAPILWPAVAHSDTIYLCIVDADGNAISFINSLFHAFGSGIMAPKSGFLLHNRGTQFTLTPGHPNAIGPCKRPLHTIIPAMLMRGGRVVAPFGVMGGQYQAMGHVQLLTNIIDRNLDVQQALDAPRSFAYGGGIEIETSFGPEVLAGLTGLGHEARWSDNPLGGGQIIWIDESTGTLAAGSDPRKDGCALGF